MLIKKTAAGLAAGAALSLFMSVGAAQAGVAPVVVNPSPSMAGASTSLSWTYASSCTGSVFEFRDVTGGGSKALCSATMDAGGTVSCTTNSLTDTGVRSLQGVKTSGSCATTSTYPVSHTVTAAPISVPTTSEWTLWGLMGAMLIGGGIFATRRFRNMAG